ncbi:YpmS family protein [Fictibacillus enclensis]|uniref:YpmS family protein n=1 Tax=Fictibacillus enclensis TaxID=1017270 RepID=UPI0024BFDC67|nr:YpmS family protein [Fictibacillus enclensis]MDM5336846.1 YpmS family protein [Fictibacillus enclensis]WHY73272.1 YpmS family protein [Fictibacillus enclensis]
MINKWKWAFLTLAALVVIGLIIVVSLLFSGGEKNFDQNANDTLPAGKKLFTIHTGKEQAAFLMNKELEDQKGVKMKAELTDQVKLLGKADLFGREIMYQMDLNPEVMKNGDLVLHEKNVRVGRLNLPGEQVLTLVSNTVDLPKWVKVYPQEELIQVQLTKMKVKKHIEVKAKKVDLKNDEIIIDVLSK